MQDFLFVKDGNEYFRVLFAEILYIEAEDKYSKLITTKRKYLILKPLSSIEKFLPADSFCRIHRSYIISLMHTISFNNTSANVAGKKFPIGKQYRGILSKTVFTFCNDSKKLRVVSNFDILRPHSENGSKIKI